MDSITQITLGAAVGEVVLGRKFGNRAMMWGAIAGTIPDLDIIANFFLEPIPALAVHRGITHSIFFSVVAAFPFAWMVHKFYLTDTHRQKGYKWFVLVLNLILLLLIAGGLGYMSMRTGTGVGYMLGGAIFTAGGYLVYRLYQYYFKGKGDIGEASYWEWYLLFFLGFFTHIWLDSHTAYGTQVFQPFSNYRIAFNNISVADPFYTLPFLICLLISAFHRRGHRWRSRWNYIGIAMSSLYMIWTVSNKIKVDRFFEGVIADENIEAIRYRTSPSILNNFLWGCVAETKDSYHVGLYSLFDRGETIPIINEIPKHHERLSQLDGQRDVELLKWFSDGYFTVWYDDDNVLMMSDLRYGAMTDKVKSFEDFVFNFRIDYSGDQLQVDEIRNRPDDVGPMVKSLVERIKGYEATVRERNYINH